MDSNETCDRVSEALSMLKMELMSIREQDVDLMKQLLKINDTIKDLSPKKTCMADKSSNCWTKSHNGASKSSRRQSYLNNYLNKRRGSCESSNGSLSSIEEFDSSTDDCCTDNERVNINGSEESIVCSSFLPVTLNMSSIPRSTSDEHLFISNVKVWKYKQSRSLEDIQNIEQPIRIS